MQVFTQALSDVINGRRVRAGLFTTFSFDPGFFELNILPTLFDQSFSQVDIACIEDPVVIKKILTYMEDKLSARVAPLLPDSRAPPQSSLFG